MQQTTHRPTSRANAALPAAPADTQHPLALFAPMMVALQHVQEGVLIIDHHGRIVTCNKPAARLLQLSDRAIGTALVESNAWPLAAMLIDALMGVTGEPRLVRLIDGRMVSVTVVEMKTDVWAFIIEPEVVGQASSIS